MAEDTSKIPVTTDTAAHRSYARGDERTFPVPDGVELDKVDASFKKGVLTVTLPKTAEAQKAEKKITVKAR